MRKHKLISKVTFNYIHAHVCVCVCVVYSGNIIYINFLHLDLIRKVAVVKTTIITFWQQFNSNFAADSI